MPLRSNASDHLFTGVRRDKWRTDKVDRVLLCELNYQADELIGLEADNSGSFVVYYDRAAVEKDPHKTTSRPFLSYLRRRRLSRSRMGTFQCRTTKKCAPRPPHASRSPSRAAFPPASTSRPLFCLSASTSRLLCAKPTAPTHLDEDATHGTHVHRKKLAVMTADTESIISRASGAGWLAWFGFGFRVAGSVQWACQKARGIYAALVTKIGPS